MTIRVLIADDSATARAAIGKVLSQSPDVVVVGEASDGAEAARLAQELRPDVVTMDIQMPGRDGLEAISEIMESAPSHILVVCGVDDADAVDISFRAITRGALELIAKPTQRSGLDFETWSKRLLQSVKLMAEIPLVRRRSNPGVEPESVNTRIGHIDVFGVAASTGGPPALAKLLAALGADLPIPIVVAQHTSAGFVDGLMRWLQSATPLPVRIARDGAPCEPGTVYLPPDGCDLEVELRRLKVCTPCSMHLPNADRLFESLARTYTRRAAAAVLTGMGEDGSRGLGAIRDAGGLTLAQDAATSTVYGMPRAAAHLAREILPLEGIAEIIVRSCRDPSFAVKRG